MGIAIRGTADYRLCGRDPNNDRGSSRGDEPQSHLHAHIGSRVSPFPHPSTR
jgi:hypothetical protein